ncbi:DNA mismatch repair protein MutS [Pseudoflavonifractor phocaeensis]|uniref:DNA mismatch repair protein MutS n=1 Tax=Pseudoflavonifractor phocaeensis TaxID=1870988 RepID=UPI00195BEE44|nr:DNA mismatch repair protein MutS [Pseudoflavonifractor phocaeensis]MBM6722888.1 DNA mismatch repair protein MutS [Pseudoflavonifractor phocaeensis]
MPSELTPMMKQYVKMKQLHPDCILFFRLGDFYEMFQEDAKLVSAELDLTLTTRDRNKPAEERTPMCGVPYHSADAYIARLIAKGYKIAICEQMEDPAAAKGLVDRDIIRIVTPGTVMNASMLEEGRNNFICAIYRDSAGTGLCVCDVSTGELSAAFFPAGAEGEERLYNELGRIGPREAMLSDGAYSDTALVDFLTRKLDCRCENGGEARFRADTARAAAEQQFTAGLEAVPQGAEGAVQAAGGLLSYLYETQKTDLSHITTLTWLAAGQYMELDLTARRNLELTETLRSKEKKGSLLWVLDKTRTPMGHRLIRAWMERPLLSPVAIGKRLGAVEELVGDPIRREELSATLREVTDLERLIGRIVYGTAGGRDLVSLAAGLGRLPRLRELLEGSASSLLSALCRALDDLPQLRELIASAIVDEPPFSVREGGFIRLGYDAEVDRLRSILTGGKDLVAGIEAREKEKTGIKSLKVGFNKVFGYYIEVSKSYYDQVPDTYIRKQTLTNCERFITQELKDLEHEILSAQDRVCALEFQLFCQVREQAAALVGVIQHSAAAAAQVDVLTSFANVAAENGYCRPQVDQSDCLEIVEGRHPVVEKVLKHSLFVPNDTHMDGGAHTVAIITGPNMAGKSTYMRQVALIVLMAQMGSFVPARSARVGVVDRVFTRIGASDDLSAGQSTFMVEMTEVAELLKNATSKSLLILDEIGRGTSTYDGMAIARAVLEYCADKKKLGAKTLFATHYHEITALEGAISGVENYHIAAKKKGDDILFLRKIVRGGADQSYGIEVAKLAGVPGKVISRARQILAELEAGGLAAPAAPAVPVSDQVTLADMGGSEVTRRLQLVDLNTLTPIEAMNLLFELKQMV